ncbi:hypothetical protein SEUCBS140593_008776 [Sporothrix eucalyptigena]|uniref:Thioesterase domain-containing protein n=1 Tax=Sporothrix eucalyptigena TaxID=1812306 RepID=A0ABP0CRH9_9PEZI
MATRHAVFVPLRPFLVRRSPLCLFQQQTQQKPWQQALRFSSMLSRPRIAPSPWCTFSLATTKLANFRFGGFAASLILNNSFEYKPKIQTPEALDEAERITNHIMNHPLVRELEADPHFHGTHPHYKIPEIFRVGNVTGDTLIGPGLMAIPPLVWQDDEGKDLVMILHVGKGLCGHPDIVHGGFVATLLDETLARCCFKAVPYEIAMTATLKIDYRAPTPANSYLVLRAHTESVKGRKAIVTGRLETLPDPESTEPGKLLAEAEGLFISPKIAPAVSAVQKLMPPVTFGGPTNTRS